MLSRSSTRIECKLNMKLLLSMNALIFILTVDLADLRDQFWNLLSKRFIKEVFINQLIALCGKDVTEDGWHGLSCLKSAGRFSRHSNLSALIKQSLSHIPSVLLFTCLFSPDFSPLNFRIKRPFISFSSTYSTFPK